ncbi:hypothetical protein HYX11_02955 [Candidatus Woesearchaeota archaeon]|nr:hypothetical protein [Candidatus Woesearchaeota archaeon]
MSLTKNIVIGAMGIASGLGIGYVAFKADDQKCEEVSRKKLSGVEEKYKGMQTTSGVASPNDIGIDYMISKDPEFKGLVFTDKSSGKQGVVSKTLVFGNAVPKYCLDYADLENITKAPLYKAEQAPQVKVYSSKEEQKKTQ